MLLLSNVGPDLSAFVCFFNFSRKEKKRKGKNKVFQLYFYDFRVPKRIRRRRRCKSCKFSLIIQITRRLTHTHTLYKGFISCYNFKRRRRRRRRKAFEIALERARNVPILPPARPSHPREWRDEMPINIRQQQTCVYILNVIFILLFLFLVRK